MVCRLFSSAQAPPSVGSIPGQGDYCSKQTGNYPPCKVGKAQRSEMAYLPACLGQVQQP